MYAVAYPEADVELLRTLIRHGATIDQISLLYAPSDLQKLAELIDGGADIGYQKEHGYDALINTAPLSAAEGFPSIGGSYSLDPCFNQDRYPCTRLPKHIFSNVACAG
jgi:hypothetical protein